MERIATDTIRKWQEEYFSFSIIRVEEFVKDNYYKRVGYLLLKHHNPSDKGETLDCSLSNPIDSIEECYGRASEYISNLKDIEETEQSLLRDIYEFN